MYKILENSIVQINSFKDINDDLIKKLHDELKLDTLVFLPKNPLFSDIQALNTNISKSYFTQLGFTASTKDIKKISDNTSKEFQIINLESSTANKHIEDSYSSSFALKWKDYIGSELNAENINFLKNSSNSTIFIKSTKTNKNSGTAISFPAKYCTGESLEQIGWVWIDNSLEKDDRIKIKNIITHWIAAKDKSLLQAGVHLYNKSSQQFFKSIGFKPTCAHIRKI